MSVEFRAVTARYVDDEKLLKPVFADATFTIPQGDLCLVVGPTGVGKSTLLQTMNGLMPHFTGGNLSGEVLIDGRSTQDHRPRDLAQTVGYVGQNPITGFVTDTVVDEIAYGLEQLGLSPTTMRKRIEETLDLLGIAELRDRPLIELSGGQQQRVAIASVLAAQPRVLVLDEPTSALDPTAAQEVLAAITNLVHDVGLTVVMAEHRLERVMQAADSALWLPGDQKVHFGPAGEILNRAKIAAPLSLIGHQLGWTQSPLSVREARRRIQQDAIQIRPAVTEQTVPSIAEPVVTATNLTVSYGELTAVSAVDVELRPGVVSVVMGRNGSGKSSLLWALQGSQASSGELNVDGTDPRTLSPEQASQHVALVPQAANDLLYLDSVAKECAQSDQESGVADGTTADLLRQFGAELAPERHPRDLSEGQRLSLALAIQLAGSPAVVLLDEPTRGLDYAMKAELADVIASLAAQGKAILVATHDVEFAAAIADEVLVMAGGDVIAAGPTREILTSSPSLAPQAAKVCFPLPILLPSEVQRR